MIGQKFGRLTVVSQHGVKREGNAVRRLWECECECGKHTIVPTSNLTKGNTRSCGCLFREAAKITQRNNCTKHNYTKTHPRQYRVWKGIRQRCLNPKHPEYNCYGGKGITICKEWENSPETFCKWWEGQCSDLNANFDIDRIDVNGNYEPSNCRLITRSENAARKTDKWLTANGVTKTCAEWCRILNRGHGYLQRIWRREGEESALKRLIYELNLMV